LSPIIYTSLLLRQRRCRCLLAFIAASSAHPAG
jgi:hypothetical protein